MFEINNALKFDSVHIRSGTEISRVSYMCITNYMLLSTSPSVTIDGIMGTRAESISYESIAGD
jgi:hypothetical protein